MLICCICAVTKLFVTLDTIKYCKYVNWEFKKKKKVEYFVPFSIKSICKKQQHKNTYKNTRVVTKSILCSFFSMKSICNNNNNKKHEW